MCHLQDALLSVGVALVIATIVIGVSEGMKGNVDVHDPKGSRKALYVKSLL